MESMYKSREEYIKQYQPFSNFKSKEEFNTTIEKFLATHKSEFTKSEFIAFRRLTKYCANAFGVATASIGTLLRGIQKVDCPEGVSKSTFHRMRRKAIKLGILKVIERKRHRKTNLTNIWVFQKLEEKTMKIDTPVAVDKKRKNKGKASSDKELERDGQLASYKPSKQVKTNNIINNRKDRYPSKSNKENPRKITRKKSNVPAALRAILAAYFDDAKYIGEFWRMAQYYVRKKGVFVEKDELVALAINSFTAVKKYMKDGTAKKPIAIYSSIFVKNLEKFVDKNSEFGCLESEREEVDEIELVMKKLQARLEENKKLLDRQNAKCELFINSPAS